MSEMKYKVIKSKSQYNTYCKILEALVFSGAKDTGTRDEIDLMTLLIEKWDSTHSSLHEKDPIQLLLSFMEEHQLKSKDLVNILGVSKGYVSEILHYKKGLSKEVIRTLAAYFKVTQDAFNRPYPLASSVSNARKREPAV